MELEYVNNNIISMHWFDENGISHLHQFLSIKDTENFLRTLRKDFKSKEEWIDFINREINIYEHKQLYAKI